MAPNKPSSEWWDLYLFVYDPSPFHCSLWALPKNAGNVQSGHNFQVRINQLGTGWEYSSSVTTGRQASWGRSTSLLGRIKLGGHRTTAQKIHEICATVAIPAGAEDAWNWAARVIQQFQHDGWLHRFPWTADDGSGFYDRVNSQATTWSSDPSGRPYEWDIFAGERRERRGCCC